MKGGMKLLLAGALAGAANGFFGAGGGMVLVPMFCRLCGMESPRALATSVAVICPISVVSAAVYLMRGSFEIMQALPFLIGGLAGGIVAGRCFHKASPTFLRRLLGALIIWGGIRNFMT